MKYTPNDSVADDATRDTLPPAEELAGDALPPALPSEAGGSDPPPTGGAPKKRRRFKWRYAVAAVAVLLVGVFTVNMFLGGAGGPVAAAAADYIFEPVSRRDITSKLSGSGALEPADSYTVTSLNSGDILSAPFEEGDIIEKDALLYEIDSSTAKTGIERAQLSLAQSQRNYQQKLDSLDDLNVKATESGTIVELHVDPGDDVKAGDTIATIRESGTMSLVIPFGTDDADTFTVGQSAEVTLDGSFEKLVGTVTKISPIERQLAGNMLVRDVTIEVKNPGGISGGQAATAMVGGAACNGSGAFEYKAEKTVTALTSGEVSSVKVKEGDTVSKNQVIVVLKNDTLSNDIQTSASSIRESELSLEDQMDKLDGYTITSPISGTIIEKHYKEGDTLESGKALCTIFDLSYLQMTLQVDELDIGKIEVGQKVTVTADALDGRVYEGVVTKININGTTANGVTSYPVTIRIDETDGLLPGMNVDAEIVLSSSENVLTVPNAALQRGNRVLVKTSDALEGEFDEETGLPKGYEYREVTTGASDNDFIEITGGLQEGDTIAYIPGAQDGANFFPGGDMVMAPMDGGGSVTIVEGGGPGGARPAGGARP
ncbi:HlyD family efflux transporter periplasmic adaptor subunit [Oscillospiraceae bacterium OttesenSCG-928-G22]|nr:HlyD family efflux transporter periplasmic adaptor subunit [Oscillospiraceae bacterium OttesenSCG-928-G22]